MNKDTYQLHLLAHTQKYYHPPLLRMPNHSFALEETEYLIYPLQQQSQSGVCII